MKHRPINYPGLEEYSITPSGEVIAKDGVRIIKQFKVSRGYMQVGLYLSGSRKRKYSVHRLVALTYVPTDDTSLDVDHIDNDKLNNNASNLQWLTRSENVAKAFQQGRVSTRKGKLSGKLVGLYLSHEAIELLSAVDNKSKYVDSIIKQLSSTPVVADLFQKQGVPQKTEQPKPAEPEKNKSGATPELGDLFQPEVAAEVLNPELACCMNETQPCKHWTWDAQMGDGYKNILSGRVMEVE